MTKNSKKCNVELLLFLLILHTQIKHIHRYTYLCKEYNMSEGTAARKFRAVLIGATGATGRYLLPELIKAKEFTEVVSLGRRKATLPDDVGDINLEKEEKSGRLKQVIIDFENISTETVGEHFRDKDVFFSVFGTSRRQAGSASNFRRIDHDYNYNLAKVAKENGVRMYSLMSSQGANKDSYFLYLQSKGKLEYDCELLKFPLYSIFRPGFLNRGSADRYLEKVAGWFTSRMPVKNVARAMYMDAVQHLNSIIQDEPLQFMYYNNQINHFCETYELN